MKMPCKSIVAAAVVVAAGWLMACAASPRTRPLNIGPPAAGPESIESVRRQLQGRWTLVAFQAISEAGQATDVKASGELSYDEYGNLTVRGARTDMPAGDPANVLRYSGRAVIDATNRRLVLQAVEGRGSQPLPTAVDPANARYYEFDGDTLKLTVKDAAGRPTAVITWKRTI